MKQLKLIPERIRGWGNIEEGFTTQKTFENHYSKTIYHETITKNNANKKIYRINPLGEDCTLELTQDVTSILADKNSTCTITATLTETKTGNKIQSQQIRIYDNDELIDQVLTDKNGQITYKYTNTIKGKHTILFKTKFENGYNATTKTTTVYVYKTAKITIEPLNTSITEGKTTKIKARLVNENNIPLQGQKIQVYQNNREVFPLSTGVLSDVNGYISFDFQDPTWTYDTTLNFTEIEGKIQNDTTVFTGELTSESGTVLENATIYLFRDNEADPIAKTTTDSNGEFELRYIITDLKKHSYYAVYHGYGSTQSPAITSIQSITAKKGINLGISVVPSGKINPAVKDSLMAINGYYENGVAKIYIKQNAPINVVLATVDQYNFGNETIDVYQRKKGDTTWYHYQTVKITSGTEPVVVTTQKTLSTYLGGTTIINDYTHTTKGTWELKAVYKGNSIYESKTATTEVEFIGEPVTLDLTIPTQITYNNTVNLSAGARNRFGKPITGLKISFYEDSIKKTNKINNDSLITGTYGVVNCSYTPKTSIGKHTIYVVVEEQGDYEGVTKTATTTIQKRVPKVIVNGVDDVQIVNQKIDACRINIQDPTGTPLSGKQVEVTINGDIYAESDNNQYNSTTKKYTTNSAGFILLSYILFTEEKEYIIRIATVEDDVYASGAVALSIHAQYAPPLPFTDLKGEYGLKGTTSTISCTIPGNAPEGCYLHMISADTNEDINLGKMTEEVITLDTGEEIRKVSYTSNWNNITKGKHQYYIHYDPTSNDKYSETDSALKPFYIADKFTYATSTSGFSNDMSMEIKNTLQAELTIYDQYNELYNGTLIYYKNDTEISTISVKNGACIIPVNAKTGDTYLSSGVKHTFHLQTSIQNPRMEIDLSWKVTFTGKIPITIQAATATGVISTVGNGKTSFTATLIQAAAAHLAIHIIDSQNNDTIYIADSNNTTIKYNSDGTKTVTTTIPSPSLTAGQYKWYAETNLDNVYDGKSEKVTYNLCKTPVLTVSSAKGFENENCKVNIKVVGTFGELYTGNIKCNNTNVKVTNGIGSYTVPASAMKYVRDEKITLSWKFEHTISACAITKTSYVYPIPAKQLGLTVNYGTTIPSTTNITNMSNAGFTDLYVLAMQEKGVGLIQTVINNIPTTIRDNIRIHALIPVLKNLDANTYYVSSGVITSNRLSNLQKFISQLLNLDIDGICYDYLHFAGTESNSSYETQITNALTTLVSYTNNNSTARSILQSAVIVPHYESSTNVTHYGQNYTTFANKLDYLIPLLYNYEYLTSPPSLWWMQTKTEQLINKSGNKEIIGQIQGYNPKNNNSLITKSELNATIQSILNHGGRGAILYRYGLTQYPANLTDLKTDHTNCNRNIKIELLNTTISKAEALTTGIGIKITDTYGGYLEGGTLGVQFGTTLKNTEGNTTIQVSEANNGIIYFKTDLSAISNGTYTNALIIKYSGNSAYMINSKQETITTVKLTS